MQARGKVPACPSPHAMQAVAHHFHATASKATIPVGGGGAPWEISVTTCLDSRCLDSPPPFWPTVGDDDHDEGLHGQVGQLHQGLGGAKWAGGWKPRLLPASTHSPPPPTHTHGSAHLGQEEGQWAVHADRALAA